MGFDFSVYDYSNASAYKEPKEAPKQPEDAFDFSVYEETPNVVQQTESKSNIIRDIGEQIAAKGISGAAGSYGNIAEALGIQTKSGEILPGQKERFKIQSNILDKANRGEPLSSQEIGFISEDEELAPALRFPTTEEFGRGIEKTIGIGEGKTTPGRIAGRAAQFAGETAVLPGGLGTKALATSAGAGTAGQALRELGAPEAIATGTEIAAQIIPSAISKTLAPTAKGAKDLVKSGRSIGLSEAQITPLVQGETKAATLSKVARKGSKTKELFGSIKEKLSDSYTSIKSRPEAKIKLKNGEQDKLINSFNEIHKELSKTLAPSPEKEAALKFIEKSIHTLDNVEIDPEHLVNFWQDINKSVKWNSISGGKKALTQLKEPIAEVLKKSSPQLAKDFEMTNELYSKYSQIAKKLKPDIVDAFVNKGEVLALAPSALALINGNPMILGGLASEAALRTLSREMLINPYFQNIANKLVKGFNSASAKGVKDIMQQAREFMERKHPDENWNFLIGN